MTYTASQQRRIDSGLCMTCGEPRLAPNPSRIRCATCHQAALAAQRKRMARVRAARTPEEAQAVAAKTHLYDAARYAAKKQARCCVRCGRRLQGADYLTHKLRCASCAKATREQKSEARRQERRANSLWAGARNGEPLPMGPALQVHTVRTYVITLDTGAYRALRELKKRDREARLKKSKTGKIEIVYQISRIIREAVRSWADIEECPTRLPSYRKMIECQFGFCADAQTVAAVERHKAARNGNLSATICDLLVATSQRQTWVAKPCAPRLSAGGSLTPDPWDED